MAVVIERHDPGERDEFRAARNSRRTVAATLLGRPFDWDTAALLLQVQSELAGLDSLLDEPDRIVRADLPAGTALGAAAGVAAAHDGATVRLALDGRDIRFEAAGDAGMHPQRWCLAFSLGCITGERAARRWLGQAAVIRGCQRGPQQADLFWEPLCRALAEIGEGQPAYAPLADAAAATEPGAVRIAEPDYVERTRRPLIALAALLREGVIAADWSLAVGAALEAHRGYYGDMRRREPLGMVAFEILALCALARERGIATDVRSSYLPLGWLDGEWPQVLLRLDFPEQAVADALEARWVIDLHGYGRGGRSHRLDRGANGLLARHSVPAADGLPAAEFVFTEARPVPGGPGLLALDPARALAHAHALAARGLLSEALAALRRVLAAVPVSGAEPAVSGADRASLTDLQAAWQARLAQPEPPAAGSDASTASGGGTEADIAAALVAAEAVKHAARPMLEALRGGGAARRIAALCPRSEDYAKVFTEDAVEIARVAFTRFWDVPPPFRAPDHTQTELSLWVSPAGMLGEPNLLSRQFPTGYRGLARWLNPHRVWLAWRFAKPGEIGGLTYDGLVWCDDHWAWFPRPYLVLADLSAKVVDLP